jgi:hypothetical protein
MRQIQSDVASQMPQTLMFMVFEIHKVVRLGKWGNGFLLDL